MLRLHRLLFFVAGMLTTDPRRKERQKPGQARARKKFTWYVVSAALLLLVRQESAISSVLGSMDIFNRVMEKKVVGKNQDFMLMNWYIQTMWLAVVGTSTNQIATVDCKLMGLWGVLTWGCPGEPDSTLVLLNNPFKVIYKTNQRFHQDQDPTKTLGLFHHCRSTAHESACETLSRLDA